MSHISEKNRRFIGFCRTYSLLTIVLAVKTSVAMASNAPPTITGCTKSPVEVSIGDTIVVNLTTKDVAFATYWLHDEVIQCTEDKCEFPTSDWGVGRHQIFGVLQNDAGRTILEITAKVYKPAFGRAPEKVEFELSDSGCSTRRVHNSDMIAQVRRGFGFVDEGKESSVLSRLPRALNWDETLRSPDDTVVRLGNHLSDEHFLLTNTTVKLQRSGDFRFVELIEGSLRSRQLAEGSPDWGIVIGKWAQIAADADGDVVVRKSRDEDEAFVNVIRGVARVVLIKGKSQRIDVEAPEVVLVPAGGQLHIQNGRPHSKILALDSKKVAQAVRLSTPFYIDPQMYLQVMTFINSEGKIPQSLASKSRKKSPVNQRIDIEPWLLSTSMLNQREETAREMGQQLIDANDGVLALEALLPHAEALKKDFTGRVLLARAYRKVGDYRLATQFYLSALEIDPQDPDIQFEYGEMMLNERNWSAAFEAFRKARNRGFNDRQLSLLNMGMAEYFLSNEYSAKNSFLASIANGTSEPAKVIAQRYIDTIEENKTFYITMMIGGIYDFNIFKIPKSRSSVGDIDMTRAYGYEYSGSLRYKAYKSELASVNFETQAGERSYLDAVLSPVSLFATDTKVDIRAEIFDWEGQNHWAYFTLTPRYRTRSLGDARSADVYSYQLETGPVMSLFSPFLTYGAETWVDPFPARDDILDPDTLEIVLTTDRSQKVTNWGFGAWFHREKDMKTKIEIGHRKARHMDAAVAVDDYEKVQGSFMHWKRHSPLWGYGLDLNYWKSSFLNSEDKRTDNGFSLASRTRFYLTSSLYFDGLINYEQQSSGREQNNYRKFELNGLLFLQL